MGVDREVGPARRAQPLLVPAGRGDLEPEDPHDRGAADAAVGARAAGDHVGDEPALAVGGVGERDQRLGAVEPVTLLDRVAHRVDVRVAGAELLVDGDAAAWPERRARPPPARPVSGRTPMRPPRRPPAAARRSQRVTSSAPIAVTAAPRWSEALARRMRRWTGSTISGSSGAITWSVASTMAVARPRWTRFSAISRPMNPPPMTTAVLRVLRTAATMRVRVLDVAQRERALDAGDRAAAPGEAPGERISASYGSSSSSRRREVAHDDDARGRGRCGRPRGRTRTSSRKRAAERLGRLEQQRVAVGRSRRPRGTAARSWRTTRSRCAR